MKQLRALAREHGRRGYSRLRKADLLALLRSPIFIVLDRHGQEITRTRVRQEKINTYLRTKKVCHHCGKPISNRNWARHLKTVHTLGKEFNFDDDLFRTEGKPFEVIKVNESQNKKFRTYFDNYRVGLKTNHTNIAVLNLDRVIRSCLRLTQHYRGLVTGDKFRILIQHPLLNISTKYMTISNGLEADMRERIDKLAQKIQSNDKVNLKDIQIVVLSHKVPRGTGRLLTTKTNIARKKGIITIQNDDSLCAARAIVTAKANLEPDKWSETQLKNGFNKSRLLQKTKALELHEAAGVPVNEFGSTLEDIKTFADHLEIQISIFDGDQFNELIYTTEVDRKQKIYLYKNKNHFDVIKSMPAFLCKDYYCHSCKVGYTRRDKHRCLAKCLACYKTFPEGNKCGGQEIVCQACNRSFFGQACYDEHKRVRGLVHGEADTVCRAVAKCLTCERTTTDGLDNHICGHSECPNCKEYCNMSEHQCFMTSKLCKGGRCRGCTEKTRCYSCKTYTEMYVFYDFECTQETGRHEVNLAVVHDYYGREHVFDSAEAFCRFVFNYENHKGYTFVAHNSKGYDCHFILRWCVENGIKPYCIYNGGKIMFMELPRYGVRFIDSLNFVTCPLSQLPKTFGLTEAKKGWFPHYFNKRCNEAYKGPMPDKSYYGYDQMSSTNRKAFLEWYDARVKENYVFDMKKELLEYCRSDVDILRRSMLQFREGFIDLSNIDPLQYITIASVVMTIYRSNHMPQNSIAVVNDVTRHEMYSKASICWLDWISERDGVTIQHALDGGELNIKGVGKVDGYCRATNTVYEFQGCFWHGCSKCYTDDIINSKNQYDMLTLRKRTQTKSEKIRAAGYNLIEVYECALKYNKAFRAYQKTWGREIVEPLNPRDAFFGGRTNITKLTHKFKANEVGRYVDYCSLYPTVQYYKEYPVGHPIKIMNPKTYDASWFGFVKCKVLPPRKLYHPVLPIKTTGKLLFPLCRSCSELKQQVCDHDDGERSFIGTWCTNEIQVALDKGYRIEKIYEVWHFKETTDNLFKSFVCKFLKIKLESSPQTTGENHKYKSEQHFKDVVKERLGIELGKIEHNPGMRAIAKLCLNSLWGKFGQRDNMKQTKYVTEVSEFYKVLLDEQLDNLDMVFINDSMIQLTYNLKGHFVNNSCDTNIFIATFTTSHARLMLYDVLNKLGDRVMGYDTDSVWYIEKRCEHLIETGDMLGELTDVLEGTHITRWCGSGPKSYAYETSDGKQVCKVKGFTLNYKNMQVINFDSMAKVIEGELDKITTVNERMITRDHKTKQIVNRYQEKDFRLCYDKRCTVETESGIDTLPYGY